MSNIDERLSKVNANDRRVKRTKKLLRDSLLKLISRYDFVIFDCEYDLKYLNLLVDYPIDEAIIVSKCSKDAIALSAQIADSSRKYVNDGQMGVILNKAQKEKLNQAVELLNSFELKLLGSIEKQEELNLDKMNSLMENIYSRLNLPQIKG